LIRKYGREFFLIDPRPLVSQHVIKKVANQLCVSKSKLRLMPTASRHLERHADVVVRPRVVAFSCVAVTSDAAVTLEQRAGRGDDLDADLRDLQTQGPML
jgi:hypothetical protein